MRKATVPLGDALYYLELEPGAPLPPDLPANAQRYRLVHGDEFRDRTGLPVGLAIAMSAAGVMLAWTGAPGWITGSTFAGAVFAGIWARATRAPRYVPSDTGEYVLAPRSVVAERIGALAGPPKLSMPTRVLCGAMGTFILGATVLLAGSAISDAIELGGRFWIGGIGRLISLLFMSVVGGAFSWLALKGEVPFIHSVEVPASPWFHALADPSAPLPDDAPMSGPRAGPRRDDSVREGDPGRSMASE